MEVKVERLRQALKLVAPAVGKNAETENVLIGGDQVCATNHEVTISVPFPESEGEEFLLPYKAARKILENTPGYEVVILQIEGAKASFTTSRAVHSIAAGNPNNFPPPAEEPEHSVEVDGDEFLRGLEVVAPYASTETSRPVLTSIHMVLVLSQLGIGICLRKGTIELSWLVGSVDGGGGSDGQGQIRGAAGTGTTGRAPATGPGWQKLSPSDR